MLKTGVIEWQFSIGCQFFLQMFLQYVAFHFISILSRGTALLTKHLSVYDVYVLSHPVIIDIRDLINLELE